jgi:hypothetical protein
LADRLLPTVRQPEAIFCSRTTRRFCLPLSLTHPESVTAPPGLVAVALSAAETRVVRGPASAGAASNETVRALVPSIATAARTGVRESRRME